MSEKKRSVPDQLQSAAPEEFGQAMTLVRLLVLEELRARPAENRPGAAQKCGLQPCELQPCAVQSRIQGKALSAGVRLAAPPVFRPVEPAVPAHSAVCLPALPAVPVPVQVKYGGTAAHGLPQPALPAMRLQAASPPLPQTVTASAAPAALRMGRAPLPQPVRTPAAPAHRPAALHMKNSAAVPVLRPARTQPSAAPLHMNGAVCVQPPAVALPSAAALRHTAPPYIVAPHLAAPIRLQAVRCVKKPPLFTVNIRR